MASKFVNFTDSNGAVYQEKFVEQEDGSYAKVVAAFGSSSESSSSGLNVVLASDGTLVPVDSLTQIKGGDPFGAPNAVATVTVTFNSVDYVQISTFDANGDWASTSEWVAQV